MRVTDRPYNPEQDEYRKNRYSKQTDEPEGRMFVYRFRLSSEFWEWWVDGRWAVKVW
jgi:hypothetical protein